MKPLKNKRLARVCVRMRVWKARPNTMSVANYHAPGTLKRFGTASHFFLLQEVALGFLAGAPLPGFRNVGMALGRQIENNFQEFWPVSLSILE